jgi:hypothetical protein
MGQPVGVEPDSRRHRIVVAIDIVAVIAVLAILVAVWFAYPG